MICPTCHGKGYVRSPYIPDLGLWVHSPCPDCGGCGIAHCCDGIDMPTPQTHDKEPDDEH